MIFGKFIRFAVQVTHEPTGLTAIVDSIVARNERDALTKASRLLRSRIWAEQNGLKRPESIIADYDLPDEDPFPHELSEYRK